MLKGPLQWACDYPGAGWHLTAGQLREQAGRERPVAMNRWLAASCHDAEELALAAAFGVDFVTLSPVRATASHPDASPLGWPQVADLLLGFDRPAYLLGGLQASDLSAARQAGAQGVAAIRAFWPD
jgi:8-oxo-dGTP diphosphatase